MYLNRDEWRQNEIWEEGYCHSKTLSGSWLQGALFYALQRVSEITYRQTHACPAPSSGGGRAEGLQNSQLSLLCLTGHYRKRWAQAKAGWLERDKKVSRDSSETWGSPNGKSHFFCTPRVWCKAHCVLRSKGPRRLDGKEGAAAHRLDDGVSLPLVAMPQVP